MGKAQRNRKKREADEASRVSSLPANASGSTLKLAHAQDHLQKIEELIQGWRDACLKSLWEEPDPEEPGYFCAWIDAPEMDGQRLSLLIGDCLQAFRTSLDHLAFELASAFTVPMTKLIEKDSSLPILSDVDRNGAFGIGPSKWVGAEAKVCGMDPAAQTVIEGLQPYNRGNAYETDPLWRLNELNNIDKHRVLHVASRLMSGATLPSSFGPNVRAIWTATGGDAVIHIPSEIAAEGRTLVARWPMLPIDPTKPMHMGFSPVLDVVFGEDTPLVTDAPVLDVLREIRDHVVGHVLPPLVGFLK